MLAVYLLCRKQNVGQVATWLNAESMSYGNLWLRRSNWLCWTFDQNAREFESFDLVGVVTELVF
jgi:hypothetical protein